MPQPPLPQPLPHEDFLGDLESRQDELLRLLDELNERLEKTLAEFASFAPQPSPVRERAKAA